MAPHPTSLTSFAPRRRDWIVWAGSCLAPLATLAQAVLPTGGPATLPAAQSLRDELIVEIIEQVKRCSPQFFERLDVKLLVAMGYGGSFKDAAQVLGRSGDGGIDGTIKEDKLGLDVICIQAKRWEGTVGRPVVQAFAGSMEGFRARKGVLITTSTFSKDAEDYITRIERKIVLVDGQRMAELMIAHNVGVTVMQTYEIKRVDSDFFAEEE